MSSASASTHLEVGEHDDVFTRQILSRHVRHETAQNRSRSLGFTEVNLFDVLRLPLRESSIHPSVVVVVVVVSSKVVGRARLHESIKSNHPTRTNLSASSCFFALNTLPTRKSTRCSSGANSAGLPSARTTTPLRVRLCWADVIVGVIHRCAAAPPRAMTPHRAVRCASVGSVVVVNIVAVRAWTSSGAASRASACKARKYVSVWIAS